MLIIQRVRFVLIQGAAIFLNPGKNTLRILAELVNSLKNDIVP